MPIVTVNPDNEKSALITPGLYGQETPALLTKFVFGPSKFNEKQRVGAFSLSVNDPAHGRMTRTIDVPDWDSGSKIPKFLRQLGISDQEQRDGFDTDRLSDIQIIANIGVREYEKSDGSGKGQANTLLDIRKLGD